MRGVRWVGPVVTVALVVGATLSAHGQTAAPETPPPAPPSIPFVGLSEELSSVRQDLDAAAARALQLEAEITALQADNRAIDERLAVTSQRIVEQRLTLEKAQARLDQAEARYRARLVEVYKRGTFDPITLLLSSDSLSDLVTRASVLTRIVEDDSQVLADLNVAAAEARYQQVMLEDLRSQDHALRDAQQARVESLAGMLAEQEALVTQLTAEAREALLESRRFTAETRQQWRLSSIPIGTDIPRATATVDSHPGVQYLVSAYMPRQYRSAGESFSAVASWYGPGFNGRGSASGQIFNEDDFTCASRTLPFGTVLALTRGDRRVIVYVNDRGPYIAGRDLDLSKAAATSLGFGGVATIQVEIVVPVQ